MQVQESTQPITVKGQAATDAVENFKPKGAFAFFILLVILGLIIWYGIYFLMLNRA